MKPIFRRGLGLLVILSCCLVWVLSTSMARKQRRSRTCQGKGKLEVLVTDSLERRFVTREDIELWLDNEYRAYAGLPMDSVDLDRIEKIICSHSAVRECESWLTDDGILHVSISQREPVVRFQDGPEEKAWLLQVIHLVRHMEGSVWQQNISQIHVNKDKNLVLIPREGKERFLFGPPSRVEEKFGLMAAYYESVAPSKDPGWYSLVDVRHRKQLVCRK